MHYALRIPHKKVLQEVKTGKKNENRKYALQLI